VARFAKRNTYGAAGIGIVAQSAYHLLLALSTTHQAWRVVLAAIVGALPPAVAALAVHMRALIRRESSKPTTVQAAAATVPTPKTSTGPVHRPIHKPSTVETTAVPSIDARPATPDTKPSTTDTDTGTTDPAASPEPAVSEVPTPAHVAARINPPRPTSTPAPAAASPAPAPAGRTRPTSRPTPAPEPAPSATDTPVTASDAAPLTLPVVSAALLARATQVAQQYRTEHGTPIMPGQLAVRLKVTSEQAAQALAVVNLDTNQPTRPTTTVNGRRPTPSARATR
jgi:hypothetical protein